MARPSSFFNVLASLCFSISTFQAYAATAQSSSSVDVQYILSGATVQTFDVDAQTGFPTEEGSGVMLPAVTDQALVPSADDHFLYVTGYDSELVNRLWVFAADATGAPQLPAIQEIKLTTNTYAFQIDPNGKFAYAVQEKLNDHNQTIAEIRLFAVDAGTGKVTLASQPVATYPLNGSCDPGAYAGLLLDGFNSDGSSLYDNWGCGDHDSTSATYYSVPVDQKTGALGSPQQTIRWIDGSNGADFVNITKRAILYFSIPNYFNEGISSLSVYPPSGGTEPLFTCTAAMLEACGYGLSDTVDRSGKYVFFQISNDASQITKLELGAKKVVDTGNYVGGFVLGFSPDNTMVYTENQSTPDYLAIYVFDPATGGVAYNGAQIVLQGVFTSAVPAVRQ
jgi:DNA-binding beta-propeller fold protein YncE